ncbi:MAG TPA: PAS domain S-box protein, partial [Chthoniobacteraceae bacterium]
MNFMPEAEAADPGEEIAGLVRQLHETQQRLHELTGGEVDAVIHPGGQPFLLREAQERLRSSEAAQRQFATRQSLILNTLPAHIAFIDPQGVILSVNQRWSHFGLENSLAPGYITVGQNYLEVCDTAAGPEAEAARESAAGIRAVLQGSAREFTLEYPCHSQAESRWFRLVVNPLEGDGLGGAVVMHLNITDRYEQEQQRRRAEMALRASEQQFSTAFEFAAIGIALVATDGRFMKVNRALCQMLGYSESDLLARSFQDISYHEDLDVDLENVARLLAGKVDSYQLEKRYHHALGHVVSAQLNVSLVRDEDGVPLQFISQIQDITERVRAREALRMQAHMLDHIGQAVIATDAAGRIIYANRFAGDLYGWLPAEMLGREIVDVTVPTQMQEQAAEVLSDLQAGQSWSGEFLVQDRHRRTFTAYVTNSPLLDARGELIGIVGISSDITERKAAEQALRASEERFRDISSQLAKVLDSSLDAICTFDEEGRFLQVSAASRWIWGYSPEELIGTPYLEKVLPEDQALTQASAAGIMAGHPTNNFENRYVRKDGSIAHVMWSAWWSEADRSMFCVARDITEANRAKEETRQLAKRLTNTLESLTDGFFMLDPEWRFTYVNEQGERMLQHSRDDLLGYPMWSTFPGLRGTSFERECERAIHEQIPI